MAHVVFGSPGIAHYQLHERVARLLLSRGHRVTILAADPYTETFFAAQGLNVHPLTAAASSYVRLPIEWFAEMELVQRGHPVADTKALARTAARYERIADALLRFHERDTVDLLWLHADRGGLHRMLHYVATETGTRVLHTGRGLLPGTLQFDRRGIDGETTAASRVAADYRDERIDHAFLDSVLAAWLAGARASPLGRTPVVSPRPVDRMRSHVRAWLRRGPLPPVEARDWRRALPRAAGPSRAEGESHDGPFVCLLAETASARRRFDAPRIDDVDLLNATTAATWRLDPRLPVVVRMPQGGPSAEFLAGVRALRGPVVLRPHEAERALLPTALACVTICASAGAAALLCGTPTVVLGRTLYGAAGVAHRARVDDLDRVLPRAIDEIAPTLRRRALTRILRDEHLWCSADDPDHNGIAGIVALFERRIGRTGAQGSGLAYRAGPSWPLSTPPMP